MIGPLELVRCRVRRHYESLYSLGVGLAAFAGLTIVALDVELCDCFLEYGQTTARIAIEELRALQSCGAPLLNYVLRVIGRSHQRPSDGGTKTNRMAARVSADRGWDAWQAAGLPIAKKPSPDV